MLLRRWRVVLRYVFLHIVLIQFSHTMPSQTAAAENKKLMDNQQGNMLELEALKKELQVSKVVVNVGLYPFSKLITYTGQRD